MWTPSPPRSFLLLLLLILGSSDTAAAQGAPYARNVVFAELLGNGLFISVNYERMLSASVSSRIGLAPGAVPLMLNYLGGSGSNRWEAGGGLLLGASGRKALGTATLGYRYQPPAGGTVFRAGFTPLVGKGGVAPWVGASFGRTF